MMQNDMRFEQGKPIGIVKSTAYNFKITTQIDIDIFEPVLRLGFNNIIQTK
jgi:2-C-methyl-D-erythritol 4-phosphate cytidylyltransferase